MINLKMSGLSAGPCIKFGADSLTIKVALAFRVFTLFLFLRTITFQKDKNFLVYKRRFFWLFKKFEIIRFTDVQYIEYRFSDIATAWGLIPSSEILGQQDTLEWYVVSLVLKDGGKRKIGTFLGEGAVSYGFVGWLLGDDLVDFSGQQEDESRTFVQSLCKLIGVGLDKPSYEGALTECPKCKRSISKYSEFCLYCGRKSDV